MSMPHEAYIDAVIDALTAADLEPTTWWISDGEIDPRGDGATTMDDAVLIWRDDHPAVNTVEHPDGLTLVWESSAGAWQWADLHDDGSNDDLEALDLPLDAAPERVVEVTRGVLAADHTLDSIAAARGITLERSGRTGADVYKDGVFVRRAARYAGESDESLLARVVRDYLHPTSDPQEWAVVAEALRPKAEAEQAPAEDPADAPQDQPRPNWGNRAERLLEAALYTLRSSQDPLSLINAAETALQIDAGDLPEDEMDGYRFPGETVDVECTCPPDLAARGGFTSTCRAEVHEPETVLITEAPSGALVTSPMAPGVELVRIVEVQGADDPETVRVAYQVVTDGAAGLEREVLAPADLRVTIVEDVHHEPEPFIPARGDAVEQWLVAQRDTHVNALGVRAQRREAFIDLLAAYQAHADTGTPLDRPLPLGDDDVDGDR